MLPPRNSTEIPKMVIFEGRYILQNMFDIYISMLNFGVCVCVCVFVCLCVCLCVSVCVFVCVYCLMLEATLKFLCATCRKSNLSQG